MKRAFTLLEIMIATVILALAMTVAWQTFSSVVRAWTNSRTVMDRMHHGDFVLEQMNSALRSMVMLSNSVDQCAFRMDGNSSGYGKHTISWVTGSSAFIPPGEDYAHGLHRIEIGGGTDEDGADGLVVTVWPYLADEKDVKKKSWFVSESIRGLSCKVFDNTKEGKNDWTEEWAYSNAIPGLIEVTLYAEPVEKDDDPVEFRQVIEIPLGIPVTNEVSAIK